jgi:phage host-nuclease inhibitor protein Gam
MSRRKRVAEDVRVPRDIAEATEFVAQLGHIDRFLALIKAATEESIAAVKDGAEREAAPLLAEAEQITRGVQLWAEANRAALTDGGKTKTITLSSGVVAWRAPPPRVKIHDVDAVIAELRERQLQRFLRVKTEIDKQAMLGEAGIAGLVPGVAIARGPEAIVIEPAAVPLAGGAA